MNRKIILAGSAGLAAVCVLGGAQVVSARPNPATPTASATDNVFTTGNPVTLPTGPSGVTVMAANLPAGKWVITAAGDFSDAGSSDTVHCILTTGAQIAKVSTIVGNPSLPGDQGPSPLISAFTLIGGVNLSSASIVKLYCSHDTAVTTAPVVDAGATLHIHNDTGSLQVATV